MQQQSYRHELFICTDFYTTPLHQLFICFETLWIRYDPTNSIRVQKQQPLLNTLRLCKFKSEFLSFCAVYGRNAFPCCCECYDSAVRCLLLQQLTQEQLWANRHTWRHQSLQPWPRAYCFCSGHFACACSLLDRHCVASVTYSTFRHLLQDSWAVFNCVFFVQFDVTLVSA